MGILNKKRAVCINILVVLLLFILSVQVRKINYDKAIGRQHEWITSHVLITLKVWNLTSASTHYYAPIYSFPYKADIFSCSFGGVFKPGKGYYYVSYPPMCFILPYFIFKTFHIPITAASLQVFNYVLHGIVSFCIFLVIGLLFNKSIYQLFIPAYIGYALYLFAPGNLWYHGNLYFSDMLEQLFFSIEVLLIVSILKSNKINHLQLFALIICTFLNIYTEWLGLLFSFVLFCFFSYKSFKDKQFIKVPVAIALTTVFTIGLILFQYSKINGLDNLIEVSKNKFIERAGYSNTVLYGFSKVENVVFKAESYVTIADNFTRYYRHHINFVLAVVLIYIAVVVVVKKMRLNKLQTPIVLLILTPVLLHYFIFFNFNLVHHFGNIKVAFLLSLLAGICFAKLLALFDAHKKTLTLLNIALLLLITQQVIVYINDYRRIFPESGELTNWRTVGETIRKYAQEDDVIFTDSFIEPSIIYYAERNLFAAANVNDALKILANTGNTKGIYIDMRNDNFTKIKNVYKINTSGDTTIVQ